MSNLNSLGKIRQGHLNNANLEDQPAIMHLLAALNGIVETLQMGDLMTFKPVRRAVRAKTAYGMTGDGKSHFWARQNPNDPAWDPTFPASFKLGGSPRSATVWFEDEIEAWLETRANASRNPVQGVPKHGRWKRCSMKAGIEAKVMP